MKRILQVPQLLGILEAVIECFCLCGDLVDVSDEILHGGHFNGEWDWLENTYRRNCTRELTLFFQILLKRLVDLNIFYSERRLLVLGRPFALKTVTVATRYDGRVKGVLETALISSLVILHLPPGCIPLRLRSSRSSLRVHHESSSKCPSNSLRSLKL